jgi:hypothetical protein
MLLATAAVATAACGKSGTPPSAPGSAAGSSAANHSGAGGSAAGGSAAGGSAAGDSAADGSGGGAGTTAGSAGGSAASLPPHRRFASLAEALRATIPEDARVLGFGELHARVDRAQVRSSLAAFTEALPSFGARVSDLVVETWIVDPKCGQQAVTATRKIETEVKRPEATKSEVALLAEAARAAGIQPHAMTLSCKDYEQLAPEKGSPDPIVMLGLVTRELTRIATSAITYRDRQAAAGSGSAASAGSAAGSAPGSAPPPKRPWIALYGGALHNDRFPAAGVAEWSYAKTVDRASGDRYVEIDLIVPELAEADASSQKQPWFPLVAAADRVLVWARGERSFVVLLPRTQP